MSKSKMALNEWKDSNGNKINLSSSPVSNIASSAGTNKGFKKRFDKVIKYYGDHLPADIDFAYVNLLTKDTLDFTENYDDGDKVRYNIFIDPATEAWTIKYTVNGQLTDNWSDTGWVKLLNTLGAYIEIPQAGDPEYQGLLTEWKVMKPASNSSTSYKKRFEKLIKYHIDHASSELESITKKDIRDNYFHLGEHYNDGKDEFDRDVVASYDENSGTFFFRILVDGKEVESVLRKGYEDFVKAIEAYMFLPDSGTQEYDDLLTESLGSTVSDTDLCEPGQIADDFKLYEDLWEGTSTEELEVTLGKVHYNLYDDSDLEAYLNQSAKVMRRSPTNKKPLEYFKLRKVDMMLRTPRFRDNNKIASRLQKVKSELEKANE